jgi:hypothetical protein
MSEWMVTDAAGIPRNVVGFVDGKPIYNAAEDRVCPECGLSFVKLRARLAEVEAENKRLRARLNERADWKFAADESGG